MQLGATSVQEYLEKVPEERKEAFLRLRQTILENLPEGFEEQLSYGMIGYVVPKSIYPAGYHCTPELPLPFVNIASQKNHIALYHSGLYADPELLEWFKNEYAKRCSHRLDMGKSCVRFKKFDDIPYDLIGELMQKMSVERWIEIYEKQVKR